MTINTNLSNRVRHTNLPKSAGLLPLFEAVVNSIHSVDLAHEDRSLGWIQIDIHRDDSQSSFEGEFAQGRPATDDIAGFKISDNGVGFDDDNMKSFEMLDSDHKASIGCRGVGRLLWLKAFACVSVESIYYSGEHLRRRKFRFDAENGVVAEEAGHADDATDRLTVVHLDGFGDKYR